MGNPPISKSISEAKSSMPKPLPVSAARFGLDRLVDPPLRADARRNYDALLIAADELFATNGPDVALDEIARRAGVGNATLYRHFPDRRDLLVAVCVSEVKALCTLGEQLDTQPDAGPAVTSWLRAYITHVSAKHGLAAAFATGRERGLRTRRGMSGGSRSDRHVATPACPRRRCGSPRHHPPRCHHSGQRHSDGHRNHRRG